ncbi:phosphatase PAP2 family protein [Rubrimonas cliftonensis]|uniref:PAP2 superfamily protein n=1 Tax=Rubrimonas cliftonensis TaxID=89524 RepID=A0A1H4EM10_9RHOB|nr:phosphatase PAP2 family protein [Rubrimonas cliftonensis]SEA85718.1 PAP2 superfamily protein [Rubrimonas cliftonensis]
MEQRPFGALNAALAKRRRNMFERMEDFDGTEEEHATLMRRWLADIETRVWPQWTASGWRGAAAATADDATRAELELCVTAFMAKDALSARPDGLQQLPMNLVRDGRWHYQVEDALVIDVANRVLPFADQSLEHRASRGVGSNYILYNPGVGVDEFEQQFWGRIRRREPSLFDIKLHFQRPRPYTAAVVLGVDGFVWETADSVTHTGLHPSLLSGHCIQGLLGGCSVLAAWLDQGRTVTPNDRTTLMRYAAAWGDRRVLAGVHYPTDNIASWTLALRLIPFLFPKRPEIFAFAREAITTGEVYQLISGSFGAIGGLAAAADLLETDLKRAEAIA